MLQNLIQLVLASLAAAWLSLLLVATARRGRNLKRYGGRQLFYLDLYRFLVTLIAASALYLWGQNLAVLRALPLPDSAVLFVTTALPTFLFCLTSGRWHFGYATALLVQGLILTSVKADALDALHGSLSSLLWQNALCDLAGLGLYALFAYLMYKAQAKVEETKHLVRFLAQQKAGHGE